MPEAAARDAGCVEHGKRSLTDHVSNRHDTASWRRHKVAIAQSVSHPGAIDGNVTLKLARVSRITPRYLKFPA